MMNGGVALAVWMGGATLELDHLVKAHASGTGPYATLLALTGCTARVDVISDTSAGGVNGAALALAQANSRADLATLRDVWVEQGRIEALLRQPFRGSPSSLLKGDDHFLPQLNAALTRFAMPSVWGRRLPGPGPLPRHSSDPGAVPHRSSGRSRPQGAAPSSTRLEDHNIRAAGRRGTRGDILSETGDATVGVLGWIDLSRLPADQAVARGVGPRRGAGAQSAAAVLPGRRGRGDPGLGPARRGRFRGARRA